MLTGIVVAFMVGLLFGLVVGGVMGAAKRADLQMEINTLRLARQHADVLRDYRSPAERQAEQQRRG